MRFHIASLVTLAFFALATGSANAQRDRQALKNSESPSAQTPLLFTENRGQVVGADGRPRHDVLFTTQGSGAQIFITATGIHYQFTKAGNPTNSVKQNPAGGTLFEPPVSGSRQNTSTHRFTLLLAGANTAPSVQKDTPSGYFENFYLAHCPDGITGVKTYERVLMKGVYPGIDWVVYSVGKTMKYDFIVHPGADPSHISLQILDADGAAVSDAGELVIQSSLGAVREAKPIAYCGGQPIEAAFVKKGPDQFSFAVGKYDRAQPLVIDPTVTWATYCGGTGSDYGFDCATDAAGNVFVIGETWSASGLASPGVHQDTFGGSYDAFVMKFSSTGARLWSTYYGGNWNERANACVLTAAGDLYIAGTTGSEAGIATAGAHQTVRGGSQDQDAFLVKFTGNGLRQWGTYYGGTSIDNGVGCATDAAGNVYLSGTTNSVNAIATAGAHQTNGGGMNNDDGFLAKFSAAGTRLWATYYGTVAGDLGGTCCVDTADNVYLCGTTRSQTDIATPGSHQSMHGDAGFFADAYLVKFSPAGARQWGTYYGGNLFERGVKCAADAAGYVYLTGSTQSTAAIATPGCHQSSYAGGTHPEFSDSYIVKFNTNGLRQWGTYYGGSADEYGGDFAFDSFGNFFFAGQTFSTSAIATPGAPQSTYGGGMFDGYLAKFNASGARQWATYFGGSHVESGAACATDAFGSIYLTGYTWSTAGIATPGSHRDTLSGIDGYLVKYLDTAIQVVMVGISPGPYCAGNSISISVSAFGTFNTGNVFTAQLSDANGSFTNPTTIGLLTSSTSGVISTTIPASTPFGTGYRIRIIASSPAFIGADNGVNITIGQAPPGAVMGLAQLCFGAGSQTYSAAPASGALSYTWTLPASWSGSSTTTSIAATAGASGGIVSVTANGACGSSAPSTLAVSIVTSLPQPGPIAGDDTVCAGASAVYSITSVPTATSYVWTLPATWSGSSTTSTLAATAGSGSGNITVSAVNACGSSPAATLAVAGGNFPLYTPGVVITGPVAGCTGQPQTFTATPTNGGPSPTYQWLKNGTATGAIGPTFTSNALQAGDVITVVMASNAPCVQPGLVTSNAITVTLYPTVVPGININVSPAAILCAGTAPTFFSNIAGGGAAPAYQWFKNGSPITGATASSFTDASTMDGDSVYCMLTSSAVCATPPSLASNKIGLTVLPAITPSVTVSASPSTNVSPGQTVTFTAMPTGGGPSPSFQWMKNGQPIAGAVGPVYSTSLLQSGDVITVQLTSSYACATVAQVTSPPVIMLISSGIAGTVEVATSLLIVPNPAAGIFTVAVDWSTSFKPGMHADLSLVDVLGRVILQENAPISARHWSRTMGVNAALADGIYQLRISTEAGVLTAPVVIKR